MSKYLVNFVSRNKRGYGRFHRLLMTTEYSDWLKVLDIRNTGDNQYIFLTKKVITVVYRTAHLSPEGIMLMFRDVRKFLVKHNITTVVIPIAPLAVRKADLDFIQLAIEKELQLYGIEVQAG